MNNREALELVKRIKAISETGIIYAADEFNMERYSELGDLSSKLISLITGEPLQKITDFYLNHKEYPTPKTDVRAVVLNQNGEILMVKEKSDNRWSLPGGWAEIGYSPKEVVVKEVKEETGFNVIPVKLLAVMDKRLHAHPSEAEYVYKLFIECKISGGEKKIAHDIEDVDFFSLENIPPLSEIRVTSSQIRLMFEHLAQPSKPAYFD